MNDEAGSSEPQEPTPAEAAQQAVQSALSQLTNPERLIAIGALLVVLLDWILGEWIMREYSVSINDYLIPLGMLAAMWFFYAGSRAAWHTFYPWMLRVGAWAMAIIGVDNLINWLRSSSYDPDGATLFFELVFTAAAVLFAIGAWQMRSDSR